MSDHFNFDIAVSINDRCELGYERNKVLDECGKGG